MNLDDATQSLRLLATAAGVPNADAVTVTVTPYKGYGERTHRGWWRIATATGWPSGVRSGGIYSEAESEEAAIDELVSHARSIAKYALDAAIADEQELLAEAREATEAAAALNVDARRAAMRAAK